MQDNIGNKIVEGNLVHWRFDDDIAKGGLVFRVVRVTEPTLAIVGSAPGPPMLTLQLDIPISGETGGKEARLTRFMRVVDPASEAALERLSGVSEIRKPAERTQ